MPKFNELGLSKPLLTGIEELGFETPTPVQEKVIPHLLTTEKSLVALAQTGTGKTAAFGLPLLELLTPGDSSIQAVILSPTRELCLQITEDLKKYSKFMPEVSILAVYGGSPIVNQFRALERGVQIIVATPGRMNDILRRKKANLSNVKRVVLDEADEMLNMGFKEELDGILEKVPDTASILLFSATMPKEVANIAKNYMQNPDEITIGVKNAGAENVQHEYCVVHAKDRYLALKRIADFYPDMYGLVFCRTRLETQEVAVKLMHDGYNAEPLHGDLAQAQRDRVMNSFRSKKLNMLVATDVAARGVDVNDLTHVINYNLPDDAEIYTHRSGRTGRAGRNGISISIIHMRELYRIKQLEKRLKKKFSRRMIPTGDEVCTAQLFSLISRVRNAEVDHEHIDQYLPQIYEILEGMTYQDLIKHFVSLEFNRFLNYYRDAPDLNSGTMSGERRKQNESNMPAIFINVGKMDKISPKDLIKAVNQAGGGKANIGNINIRKTFSLVELDEKFIQQVIDGLNSNVRIGNRSVSARRDDKSKVRKSGRSGGGDRRQSSSRRNSGSRRRRSKK